MALSRPEMSHPARTMSLTNVCTRRRSNVPGAGQTPGTRSDMTNFTCIIDGCPSLRPGAHGLCNTHYARKRRTGTLDERRAEKVEVLCGADGCERAVRKVGYCAYHYNRQRKAGKSCGEAGCDRPVAGSGLCSAHYSKMRRNSASCDVENCTNKQRHRGLCEPHYAVRLRAGQLPPLDCQYCGSVDGVRKLVCEKCRKDRRTARMAQKWAAEREQRRAVIAAAGMPCAGCGTSLPWASRRGMRCVPCSRYVGAGGYVYVRTPDRRQITEHRYVMEQHIGRPLLPSESVHHVDGQRSNNDISNLELWTNSHPAGQRVLDQLRWAREIVALYGNDFDQGRLF